MARETWWQKYCRESREAYMRGEHAVYGLVDPRTQAVRYIGCTVYPETRYDQHINPARVMPTYEWVHELRHEFKKPQMVIFATIEGRANAEQRERELIAEYNAKHPGQLLNRKAGRPFGKASIR